MNKNKKQYYFVKLPFKTSLKKLKDEGLECEGEFTFYFDLEEKEVIYQDVKFYQAGIDVYNTKSWFTDEKKSRVFEIREEILKSLGYEPKPRPKNIRIKEIKKLEGEQKKILSDLWNKHKITIRNIIKILSGSNPTGTKQNPDASQIWLNTNNFKYNEYNFALLLQPNIKTRNLKDKKPLHSEEMNFKDFMHKYLISEKVLSDSIKKPRRSQNQKKWREHLLIKHLSRCAICPIENKKLLDACHIVPHRYSKKSNLRWKRNNGLLLCKLHHKMFGDGAIVFLPNEGRLDLIQAIKEKKQNYNFIQNNKFIKLPETYQEGIVEIMQYMQDLIDNFDKKKPY